MFSICCNSRIKSWRNRKKSWNETKIKPFINKYNWEEIHFRAEKNNWKKFEKNGTIALNVFYAQKENISCSIREKQVIILIISNEEG